MRFELVIRFDYGSIVPWVRKTSHGVSAIGGPTASHCVRTFAVHGEDFRTIADFVVSVGQRVAFDLTWHPSHVSHEQELDLERALSQTEE